MEHALLGLLSRFTYPALVGLLAAAGMGLPISEDLTLLVAGALAGRGAVDFWGVLVAGYLGVVLGDVLIWRWGHSMGPRASEAKLVRKALTPERMRWLEGHFARHGALTVVVARHTPILRVPAFFLAGASRVPFGKFLLADAVSSAVTVPIVVWLGFKFGENLDVVRRAMHHVEWVAAAAVALLLVAVWLVRRRLREA